MGFVTVLWSASAGVAVALAIVSGAVGMTARRNSSSLTLCVLGFAVAASAYFELRMMHSTTPAEYGEWVRWYHLPVFVALTAQALFVRFFLGTGRWWLLSTVIIARAVVLAVNFTVHPDFNFVSIASLNHLTFLGENVSTFGAAIPRTAWQTFSLASTFLLAAYAIDAAASRWRIGGLESKRKALSIGLGIAVPWLCTITYNQFLLFGLVRVPLTTLFWLLGSLFVMMFELTRDYILGRRALAESAELQRQLMRIERVGVLDQLASGLAHQLAQPLSASSMNLVVALKLLEEKEPNLEELREILTDVSSDVRRGGELINRLRRFIKQHAIELQPVRVEDVVQDSMHLVRPEATARHIALTLQVPANLPNVMGDRVHLSQVLINLLLNSIHALQSRAPEFKRIVIEARADDRIGQVEITVRDTGPGIPESISDTIFEPFYTTKPEGMGMGLALSRTIVEAHGGHLWFDRAESQKGGSVFRFTLQRAASDTVANPAAESVPRDEVAPIVNLASGLRGAG
jgi:signal transduction histidine kinase